MTLSDPAELALPGRSQAHFETVLLAHGLKISCIAGL